MGQTILITSDDKTAELVEYEHIISVEDLLGQVSRDEILDTFRRVSALDVPDTGCIAFSIIWRRFTKSRSNNLVRAVVFSQKLESRLDELDVTHGTLVCGESLEASYVRVVEDVAETSSLKTRRLGQKRSLFKLSVLAQMMLVVIEMGVVIGDWFITRLIALLTNSIENSIVYIPPIERLDSTVPVVEAFDTKPQTIITEPFWYYAVQFSVKPRLESYDPTFSGQYLSLTGFIGQIRDLGTIFREVLTTDSFAPDLADAVEAEFGVCLDSTTNGLVSDKLSNLHLVRALVLRRSLRSILSTDHVKKVVTGTMDPIGRAVIHEASEQQVQVYSVPHSVATIFPPYPKTEVIEFVSGEWDIQYNERVVPRDRWWQWIPAGRPYLSSLAEQYGGQKDTQPIDEKKDGPFKLLLATQPFSLTIRKQFVETMLSSFDPDRFEITIKPHPDENVDIYKNFESDFENVRVITASLYEEIVKSDLTVTVNSNVGLESIVVGTPVVCYNAWEPFILEQTFATTDEVPLFKSEAELQTFASELNSNEILQMGSRQQVFVNQNYCMDTNIAANIANYIESDSIEI